MDLLEFAEHEEAKCNLKAAFDQVPDDLKLSVCRDLMIDQICEIIDKFPLNTQKEMLALIVDTYMQTWGDNGKATRLKNLG